MSKTTGRNTLKTLNGESLYGPGNITVGGGVDEFTELTDTPASYSGQTGKFVKVNATEDGLEFATLAGGGDMLSTNNLSDVANVATARTNLGLNTTANQTDSTDKRFMTDAQESKLDAITGTNTGDETTATIKTKLGSASGSTDGYLLQADWNTFNGKEPSITAGTTGQYYRGDKTFQTLDKTAVGLGNVANVDTTTTANITDSTNKRFVTDAQQTVIGNTSGTNTGDQTSIVGISGTKAQFDTACSDGNFVYTGDAIPATNITQDASNRFVTDAEKSTWNGKQNALTNPVTGTGTNNEIAAFNSTGSTITSLPTATYPTLTELSYVKGVTSALQTQLNGKEPTITNGFGITGTTTKAVSLTSTQAFCTQETTISATAYADITGASITLAAGTWLIMGTINGASQTTTVAVMIGAITDGANTVIAEGAQHIVAGTATVRTWGNLSLSAVVTPSGSTTYKLRGARGVTTQTGNWIASDGTGQGTANNVSNNSDKSTVIMAVRIA